jgi:hypothetical protein
VKFFGLTLPGPGGAHFSPPPVMIICCTLRDAPMKSKLLEFLNYHPNFPLKNIFFPYLSFALRKLTANDKNQELISIKKQKKYISFHFFTEKT